MSRERCSIGSPGIARYLTVTSYFSQADEKMESTVGNEYAYSEEWSFLDITLCRRKQALMERPVSVRRDTRQSLTPSSNKCTLASSLLDPFNRHVDYHVTWSSDSRLCFSSLFSLRPSLSPLFDFFFLLFLLLDVCPWHSDDLVSADNAEIEFFIASYPLLRALPPGGLLSACEIALVQLSTNPEIVAATL